MRHTHEDRARRLGKSRTSIAESLSLNGIPEEVKNLCRLADIHSKSLLLQIVGQGDPQKMVALVEKTPATRSRRPARRSAARPRIPSRAGRRRLSAATKHPPSCGRPSSRQVGESAVGRSVVGQAAVSVSVVAARRSSLGGPQASQVPELRQAPPRHVSRSRAAFSALWVALPSGKSPDNQTKEAPGNRVTRVRAAVGDGRSRVPRW